MTGASGKVYICTAFALPARRAVPALAVSFTADATRRLQRTLSLDRPHAEARNEISFEEGDGGGNRHMFTFFRHDSRTSFDRPSSGPPNHG